MEDSTIGTRLKRSVTSGLAYGGGMAVGSIVAQILFLLVSKRVLEAIAGEDAAFVIGVLLVFVIAMIGGSVAGFIGGWTLPTVGRPRGRWGYAWQSAFSIGLPYGTIFYLILFLIYALAVGDLTSIALGQSASTFAILGGLLGTVAGLVLGLLTVGRRFWRVTLSGLLGFAVGGAGLGLALWFFFANLTPGALATEGPYWLLLLGLFLFGLFGGIALGFTYTGLARAAAGEEQKPWTRVKKIVVAVVVVAVVLFLVARLWPLLYDVSKVMMPRKANLSQVLDTNAVGTHWTYEEDLPFLQGSAAVQPVLAAHGADSVALAWVEGDRDAVALRWVSGTWSQEDGGSRWETPITFDVPGSGRPIYPQMDFDPGGAAHVLWSQENGSEPGQVFYARCEGEACSEAVQISDPSAPACDGGSGSGDAVPTGAPAIAVDGDGTVLAVWEESNRGLAYATWSSDEPSPSPERGCVPSGGTPGWIPRLAGSDAGHVLVFTQGSDPDGDITLLSFADGAWAASSEVIGAGFSPEVWIDPEGSTHAAWCDEDALARYWDGASSEAVSDVTCAGRPEIGRDQNGRIHVVFPSDEVESASGNRSSRDVLYESIRDSIGWSAPMIVALPGAVAQPSLVSSAEGILHLAWAEGEASQGALSYASQRQYDCEGYELTGAAAAVLQVAGRPEYRSPDDPIAYCQNRYDRLVYTPNPAPEFSEQSPTTNGGFDTLAELMSGAQYEVLLSTMAYEKAHNGMGPGVVLGEAVAGLYNKLKEDPSQYPRGLTVRILLGNSPPFSTLELNSQLWDLLGDLREAGVETMEDPELGWRLEVSNYEGAFPHSHSKVLIVDGKVTVPSGFNIEFRPMPEDHPSGQGKGDTDLGIQITGPVAQDAQRVFDDLWNGAVQRHCSDLYPAHGVWQVTCRDRSATVDHVPEVRRYYLAGGDSTALSMFRSQAHDAADEEVYAALASASDSIDVLHVSFSFPLLCNLNHFYYLCDFDEAPEYIAKLFDAIEEREVRVRVLVGVLPFQGIENTVTVDLLRREAEKRGLSDLVEFRFFDGLVHSKTTLIDDEFLIVGSQNLHYSAFGHEDGLTEYSIGVNDPKAVDDFKRLFEYHWQRGQR